LALILKSFCVSYILNFVFHEAFGIFLEETQVLVLICHGLKVSTMGFQASADAVIVTSHIIVT